MMIASRITPNQKHPVVGEALDDFPQNHENDTAHHRAREGLQSSNEANEYR